MSRRWKNGDRVRLRNVEFSEIYHLHEPTWPCTFDCDDPECVEWIAYPASERASLENHCHINECEMEAAE